MALERLNKILARAGVSSRRGADELIQAGAVEVNGKVVSEPGSKADPREDRIRVRGKPLPRTPRAYLLFHKPAKVITALKDPQGRQTVVDFLPPAVPRVYPVGRLDWDCQGALLLTNDGDLAHRLMHPGREIPKVYRAKIRGVPAPEALVQLAEGIELDDGMTAPANVTLLSTRAGRSWIRLVIHEGRNRQVKRMFAALDLPLLKLRRDAFAGLTVDGLPVGQVRPLRPEEIARLREIAGLPQRRPQAAKQPWRPPKGTSDEPYGPFGGRPVKPKPPSVPGPPEQPAPPGRRQPRGRRRVVRPPKRRGR